MAKILYITQRYAPAHGGAEIYAQILAERSVEKGHEVNVWTSDALEADALWYPKRKKVDLKEEVIDGVNVKRFKTSPFFLNNIFFNKGFRYVMWHLPNWHLQCLGSPPTCIGMYMQLLKSKKKLPKYDIIHVSAMPYNSLFYVGMNLAERTGAKLYITPFAHSNVTGKYVTEDKYFHPRVLPFYAKADKIFIQTEAERNALSKFFDKYEGKLNYREIVKSGYDGFEKGNNKDSAQVSSKTPVTLFLVAKLFIAIMTMFLKIGELFLKAKVQHMEIDKKKMVKVGLGIYPDEISGGEGKKFREKYAISPDYPIVYAVGAKVAVKGTFNLVNAMEILWKKGLKANLVLAGNPTMEFEEFWKGKSDMVKGNSIIIDWIEDDEKHDLFDAGNIFTMVSKSESFGIVYLEAWLYKKPVIACDIPVLQEIVDEGKDGYLVEFDNAEQLAGRIEKLLRNPRMRIEFGEMGYKKVVKMYTWKSKFKILDKYFNA